MIVFVPWLTAFALGVWAAIDAGITPDTKWGAADQNKLAWILIVLLLPIAGPIAYLVAIRPKVRG